MIKIKFNSKLVKLLISGLTLLAFNVVHADVTTEASIDTIKQALAEKLPNIDASQIEQSQVKDIYSVDLGERYAYVTSDGKHLFIGELIDMESGLNYTQLALGQKRVKTIKAIPKESYIIFPAKNKKHSITVFTDIDCGYCRKMHNEMDELNDLGIEVKYLLRPRAGPQSESWKKADAVYCSKNQQKNLTRSKQGMDITMKSCDGTPTMENVSTAQSLGFGGTPTVLSEQGNQIGGYIPAKKLLELLDAEKANAGS